MKYEAIAPLYDKLMSHVEYDEWLALIDRIISRYLKVKDPSIFEIGGGTGVLGKSLLEQGFSYTGSDISFQMCKEASKKGIPFLCADARSIPSKQQFDLIVFLYDGINYLTVIQDYKRLFSQIHKCLSPDGLFLFDITTETNSLRHFIDYLDFEEYDGDSLIRHSHYNKYKALQYNDFTIFRRAQKTPPLYQKFNEFHIQKIFPARTIENSIPKELFSVVGIWDGFSFHKYTSRSERIHFLLRKIT